MQNENNRITGPCGPHVHSALLPALAAQETENVSIAAVPAFREVWRRMKVLRPAPAVQKMKALRRSPAAMQEADVSQSESDGMPMESGSSISDGSGS